MLILSCSKEDNSSQSSSSDPQFYTLTININPSEGGSVNVISGRFSPGQSVEITASPNQYFNFKEWTGDLSQSSENATIIMDSNKSITANFNKFFWVDNNGVTLKVSPETPFGTEIEYNGQTYKVVDHEEIISGCINGIDISKTITSNIESEQFIGLLWNCDTNFNADISHWDISNATNLRRFFYYSHNFNQDISNWDVSNVTDMHLMFANNFKFNQPIGSWDVSNVTDMYGMFSQTIFNQPIGDWDVSNVLSMEGMFHNSSFNQPIGDWDVSKVTIMRAMFSQKNCGGSGDGIQDGCYLTNRQGWPDGDEYCTGCTAEGTFNQDISNWDVSNVTNMEKMFQGQNIFNQPLNSWDVSNVSSMKLMFRENWRFNQPLNDWNVSNVTNMMGMFQGTIDFNQPLNDWDVSNVTNMQRMFYRSYFYNQDLSNWVVSQIGCFREFHCYNDSLCDNYHGYEACESSWTLSKPLFTFGG